MACDVRYNSGGNRTPRNRVSHSPDKWASIGAMLGYLVGDQGGCVHHNSWGIHGYAQRCTSVRTPWGDRNQLCLGNQWERVGHGVHIPGECCWSGPGGQVLGVEVGVQRPNVRAVPWWSSGMSSGESKWSEVTGRGIMASEGMDARSGALEGMGGGSKSPVDLCGVSTFSEDMDRASRSLGGKRWSSRSSEGTGRGGVAPVISGAPLRRFLTHVCAWSNRPILGVDRPCYEPYDTRHRCQRPRCHARKHDLHHRDMLPIDN